MFPIDPPHILIVEDDKRARSLFERYLAREGFTVTSAQAVSGARKALKYFTFQIILCDVLLPHETGLEWVAKIRAGVEDYPKNGAVILLSALGDGSDRVAGLKAGADDYIVKPPEPEELTLRILSLWKKTEPLTPKNRHMQTGEGLKESFDGLDIEKRSFTFRDTGESVTLTETESKILYALLEANGAPISRHTLMKTLGLSEIESRGADIMVARLRKKLERDSKNPERLLTVRGEGYVWKT